jgi:crotonobetainyl-CoA:carnitine CoA-transferase CaiB-like acyl-CoA transferase
VRLHGQRPPAFAPLSRFWPAADGWVRTHANYAWHQDALVAALGLDSADPQVVAAAIAALPAESVEDRAYAANGLAVAVRSVAGWRAIAGKGDPLVTTVVVGDSPPRSAQDRLRVLDLTRVIAGPVATRFIGALGHDVLRVDPPDLPELQLHRVDGLLGKRSAVLDATTPDGLARLHELLRRADVLVHGYRPGALARFGLTPAALAERHPGLVVVGLSAWGRTPGWAGRRGFDSLVQAATGLALRESPDGQRPGTLPCQLLDHGTGYLMAAAVLDAVYHQHQRGGT